AGAGGEDVALLARGHLDRVALMPVEGDVPAARVARPVLDPEDPLALRVEQVLLDEVVDGAAAGEHRVQRNPRLGPLVTALQLLVDVLLDPAVANVDESGREGLVVVDQPIAYVPDVHRASPSGLPLRP